jgi:hypothetical protein
MYVPNASAKEALSHRITNERYLRLKEANAAAPFFSARTSEHRAPLGSESVSRAPDSELQRTLVQLKLEANQKKAGSSYLSSSVDASPTGMLSDQ